MIEIKQVLQLHQPHTAQVPEARKHSFQWKVPSLTGGDVTLFWQSHPSCNAALVFLS